MLSTWRSESANCAVDRSIQIENLFEQRFDGFFRSVGGRRRVRDVRVSFYATVVVAEWFFGFSIYHYAQRLLCYDTKDGLCIFHDGWVCRHIWVIICMRSIGKCNELDVFGLLLKAREISLATSNRNPVVRNTMEDHNRMIADLSIVD